MKFLDTERDSDGAITVALTERAEETLAQVEAVVREILLAVRTHGDEAVVEYTRKLDWPGATIAEIEVSGGGLVAASGAPLAESAARIEAYHRAEMENLQSWSREFGAGRRLGQLIQPMERAGVYVPGGKAVYPSTVLMATIPAIVAGVREIVVCSPASRSGDISPVVIEALRSLSNPNGSIRLMKLGGAVAIGALAYGTATLPRVDVIVGPGNDYVNTAKRIVSGDVGIDMLAGPSDIAIIADEGANPAFVAADLLAQTEHGPENRGVVLSPTQPMIDAIVAQLDAQRSVLSRKAILDATADNLIFVKTRDLAEAVKWSNVVAPEHLELQVRDPDALLASVRNAGAILLGDYSSAPIGDYLAGPSHTLPTAGAARFSSPLSVSTFLKRSSIIHYSRDAAVEDAEIVARFAEAEGFDAHAAAARIRSAR